MEGALNNENWRFVRALLAEISYGYFAGKCKSKDNSNHNEENNHTDNFNSRRYSCSFNFHYFFLFLENLPLSVYFLALFDDFVRGREVLADELSPDVDNVRRVWKVLGRIVDRREFLWGSSSGGRMEMGEGRVFLC